MAPWDEALIRSAKDMTGPRRPSKLGDSAYASAEDWNPSSFPSRPSLRSSRSEVFADFQDRRKVQRMHIVQSIINDHDDGSSELQRRVESLSERLTADRKSYYQEIEHLRHGLHKLLDTCQSLMSTGAFLKLRDSLHLGVRFLTEHAEGEMDTPLPSSAFETSMGMSTFDATASEIAELQQTVGKLEDEVQKLERENSMLKKELAKHNAKEGMAVRAATLRSATPKTQSTDMQTDPVFFAEPGQRGGRPAEYGEPSRESAEDARRPLAGAAAAPPAAATASASRPRPAGTSAEPSGAARDDDSDDDGSPDPGRSPKTPKKKKASEKHASKAVDDEARRDLAIAKDELEQLRRKLAERDKQLAEERRKAAAAGDAQAGQGGSEQARVEVINLPQKAKDKPSASSGSKLRTSGAAAAGEEKTKRGHGSLGVPGQEQQRDDDGAAETPSRPTSRGASKSTPFSQSRQSFAGRSPLSAPAAPPKPVMVDKCIATDPEPAPPEPPPRVRGRSVCAPAVASEPPLNKHGVAFQRSVRAEPSLGAALSGSLLSGSDLAAAAAAAAATSAMAKGDATPSAKALAPARSKAKIGLAATAPPGASPHRPGGSVQGELWSGSSKFSTDFAPTSSVHSLGGSLSGGDSQAWRDAEPYLLQVWEARPEGHKKPSKRELVSLGALTPSPPLA